MKHFTIHGLRSTFGHFISEGAISKLLPLLTLFVLLLPASNTVLAQDADPQPVARAEYNKTTQVLTFLYGAPSEDVDDNIVVVKLYDPIENTKWFNNTYSSFSWTSDIKKATSVVIEENFNNYKLVSCRYMFKEFTSLLKIEGIENLNTSDVTDMSYMFRQCKLLSSLDVSSLNTAKVSDMSFMFSQCEKLSSLDVSSFNTANVTNMQSMFYSCEALTTLTLSDQFTTDNVEDMGQMFGFCYELTSLNLSNFNTDNVTHMFGMFYNCSSLTSLDLSNFNTANVTNMGCMFQSCSKLESLVLSDKFKCDKVLYTSSMFMRCGKLISLDLSNFNTDNVIRMDKMFRDCSNLVSLALSNKFNTDKVTDMEEMFYNCSNLTSLNLSGFNTANVTNMKRIFNRCSKLNSLVLGDKFTCDKVENMAEIFYNCSSLTSLDLSSFNTDNVTNMNKMFYGCSKLKSLVLGDKFTCGKVKNMDEMYYNCSSLTSLDLSKFNTANVTSMSYMFYSCSSLTSLNLSKFNTTNVTSMNFMFYGCNNLINLDLSSFNTIAARYMGYMFANCSKLQNVYISNLFTTDNISSSGYMFSTSPSFPNYSSAKIDATNAHYNKGGYFKTYYKIGDEQKDLYDGNLTVDDLTLTDGKDFMAYAPFTATKASYSRTLKTNATWATLCLPFEVSLDEQNFRAFTLLSATDNTVELQEVENTIAAGTPVLIKMNQGETLLSITENERQIERTAQTVKAADDSNYQLVGIYAQKMFNKDDNNNYILKGDKLMNPAKMLEGTTVKAVGTNGFRAYMVDNTQTTAGANMFSLGFSSDATAIDSLTGSLNDATAEYYDLQGHKLAAPQKGINIVKRGNKTTKLIIK